MWRFPDESCLERKLQEKEERIQFLESRLAYFQDLCEEYKKAEIDLRRKYTLLEAELKASNEKRRGLEDDNLELLRCLGNRVKVIRCCKRGGCCR